MRFVSHLFVICLVFTTASTLVATEPLGYQLSWADEFNGTSLDESSWWYRADEKQQSIQLPSNVEVADGSLILNLTPLDTPINGFDAAGAGVISSQRFRYGYYEVRSKLGDGINDDNDDQTDEGWWHAFWAQLADTDGNGNVGTTFPPSRRTEIDIYENGSNNLSRFTQHVLPWNENGQIITKLPSNDLSTIPVETINDWHTYGMEWTPNEVRFFVDDVFQHAAIYDPNVYEHTDVNVWLTAISTNGQSSDQERSEARYDYFRFYTPGDIMLENGESLAIGADSEISSPIGGSLVSGSFGSPSYDGGGISGNVIAKNGSTVHGVATLWGNLEAQGGSTIRIGGTGLVVSNSSAGVTTSEDFESYTPGVAFSSGSATGLTPNWTFYDLGTNITDARFEITGADGAASQPTELGLSGESQMFFQTEVGIDFANGVTNSQPFAGAVAISDDFDTSGKVDIIEADFVFDGFGDPSGQFLDTKLVFGFQDIDNWFSLSVVAGSETGTNTQLDVIANVNGDRNNVFGASGSGTFNGNFPQDTLLTATVVHDAELGYVEFSIAIAETGEVLAESFIVDDMFKADGKVGFAVNNDATGYDNFSVTTLDTFVSSQITTLNIDGDYTQADGAILEVDIATNSVYDKLEIEDTANLDGLLDVQAMVGFDEAIGTLFELVSATEGITGGFSAANLPNLDSGLALQLIYGANTISVEVVLAGDFNKDGSVDAADYTLWRDALGSVVPTGSGYDLSGNGIIDSEDYNIWVANFGNTSPATNLELAQTASVPESSSLAILLIACLTSIAGSKSR